MRRNQSSGYASTSRFSTLQTCSIKQLFPARRRPKNVTAASMLSASDFVSQVDACRELESSRPSIIRPAPGRGPGYGGNARCQCRELGRRASTPTLRDGNGELEGTRCYPESWNFGPVHNRGDHNLPSSPSSRCCIVSLPVSSAVPCLAVVQHKP
jgi:hypothetical protein